MSNLTLSSPGELSRAYDHARLVWLRRRFTVYAWITVVLYMVDAAVMIGDQVGLGGRISDGWRGLLAKPYITALACDIGLSILFAGAFITGIAYVRRRRPDRRTTLRLIGALFIGAHLADFFSTWLLQVQYDTGVPLDSLLADNQSTLLVLHVFTALIIPWTVREAALAVLPLVTVHAVATLLLPPLTPAERAVHILLVLMIGLPGMGVCWLKQALFSRRFHFRSFRHAYHLVNREVTQARRLHESFFPAPIGDGPLRLDFFYRPMAQLGGDYLHARMVRDGQGRPVSLLCAVIDVTGHGLAATLTANHLHALLVRETRHDGPPDPGRLIAELNRYMYESFSGLSVFASALCMRLDLVPARVVWASAGHPPATVIDAGRPAGPLDSTACLLGALAPEDFDPAPQSLDCAGPTTVLAFTDGASELPLARGGMLGIAGVHAAVHELAGRDALTAAAVYERLAGLGGDTRQDDILLVRLHMDTAGAQGREPHQAGAVTAGG